MQQTTLDRNAIVGKVQERAFVLERGAIDEQSRTVKLAASSEAPYDRWWGVEVLDHSAQSIRLHRVQDGAPVLVSHDTADQVGVIESIQLGTDRVLRATVRFGRSARAAEVFQDVVDGIRRKVSIGYMIHDLVLEKQEEDINTYRVTDWEPYEISLVAVPADNSVGVGRSRAATSSKGSNQMEREQNQPGAGDASGAEGRQTATAAKADIADALRVRALLAAGDEFLHDGGPELARELIALPGAGTELFKARLYERMRGRQRPLATAAPADMTHYGDGARSGFRYGGKLNSYRSEQDAYRVGMWLRGTFLGDHKAADWCKMNGVRAMGEDVLSTGGATVPIELSESYIRLVEQYGVFRRNARNWQMGSDQLKIARRASGLSVFLVGENDASAESQQGWDNVTLSVKKFGTLVRVSNELMEDSGIALADSLTLDVALAFALNEDQCGFLGDATSTYGGMLGVLAQLIDGTHNAGKVAAATGHNTFPEIDNVDLTTLMSKLPLYARPNAKFYCSSVAWDTVFSRLMAVAGGNRVDTLGDKPRQAYLGYDVEMSQVMPAGPTTDYTNKVMILFGDLSMSSAMGTRRALTIRTSYDRYLEQDQVAFMCTERFDIVNHSLGDNTTAGPVVGLIGA